MAYKQLKLWFDPELAQLLSNKLLPYYPKFDAAGFVKQVAEGVPPLELKDRVELIADLLNDFLPGEYPQQWAILANILGPPNPSETGMFTDFYWVMPIAKFVEKYGLNHLSLSFQAIEAITQRNTGEFTIRPYIAAYPEKTMDQMMAWSRHENFHVRRLASEGGRPRLPWASKIQPFIDDPSPLLPILENLRDDPSKYVQKSVANCINDILKDNFTVGQSLIFSWMEDRSKARTWIIKHAIRNFRKKEIPWAMELMEQLK